MSYKLIQGKVCSFTAVVLHYKCIKIKQQTRKKPSNIMAEWL